MPQRERVIPDSTAVRVALWRALHVECDSRPHVLDDTLGLKLIEPGEDWRHRPDMHSQKSMRARASVVGQARFIEDLVHERASVGVHQYVILGAGLDTFAQRHAETNSKIRVFEIDQPLSQAWKEKRLSEKALPRPDWLHFVPVDRGAREDWWAKLLAAGFDPSRPAVIASTSEATYLTRDAIKAKLKIISTLAKGSTLAMSFMLPIDLVEEEERSARRLAEKFAATEGNPFLSLLSPRGVLALVKHAGFKDFCHITAQDLHKRYLEGRSDRLKPSSSEELVIAST